MANPMHDGARGAADVDRVVAPPCGRCGAPGVAAQVLAPVSGRFGLPPEGKLPMTGDRVAAGQALATLSAEPREPR